MTDTNITASTGITVEQKPSLLQLEVEIKFHLNQAGAHIIEVGKRLIAAKELVAHGAWKDWLEQNFNLSAPTARKFMQVAERFGKTRIDTRFNPTQMIAMLALPEVEEENFIATKAAEGKAVESMTVKQLRDEIKRYKAELKAKDDELSGAQIDIEARDTHIKQLNDELDSQKKFRHLRLAPADSRTQRQSRYSSSRRLRTNQSRQPFFNCRQQKIGGRQQALDCRKQNH